jgi:hypothetical protein
VQLPELRAAILAYFAALPQPTPELPPWVQDPLPEPGEEVTDE